MLRDAINRLDVHRTGRGGTQLRELPQGFRCKGSAVAHGVRLALKHDRQDVLNEKPLRGKRTGKPFCNVVHISSLPAGVDSRRIAAGVCGYHSGGTREEDA